MQLFIQIALMCLINMLLPEFIRTYLKVSRFWKISRQETQSLQAKLDAAREELDDVQSAEHAGEYAKKIKTMRAERKVADAEAKIKSVKQMENLKQATIDTVAYYVSKVLFALVVLIVTARNRSLPVFIFDERFSLAPMGGLLSFPTGIYNAISVPAWTFSCNFTFRLVYGLIKK